MRPVLLLSLAIVVSTVGCKGEIAKLNEKMDAIRADQVKGASAQTIVATQQQQEINELKQAVANHESRISNTEAWRYYRDPLGPPGVPGYIGTAALERRNPPPAGTSFASAALSRPTTVEIPPPKPEEQFVVIKALTELEVSLRERMNKQDELYRQFADKFYPEYKKDIERQSKDFQDLSERTDEKLAKMQQQLDALAKPAAILVNPPVVPPAPPIVVPDTEIPVHPVPPLRSPNVYYGPSIDGPVQNAPRL